MRVEAFRAEHLLEPWSSFNCKASGRNCSAEGPIWWHMGQRERNTVRFELTFMAWIHVADYYVMERFKWICILEKIVWFMHAYISVTQSKRIYSEDRNICYPMKGVLEDPANEAPEESLRFQTIEKASDQPEYDD